MGNSRYYQELFDFHSTPHRSPEVTGLLVFGRKDPLVARKVVDLSQANFATFVVITGGKGKDSGDLAIPESEYLAQEAETFARAEGLILPAIFTETQASNGAQNVQNSLTLMRRGLLPHRTLTAVAHATSLRRLGAMIQHESTLQNDPIDVYRIPSDYVFDPSNPSDQLEARQEMLRLADWPAKNWLQPQPDLPANLVDFVRDQSKV